MAARLPTPQMVRQQIGTVNLQLREALRRLQAAQRAQRDLDDLYNEYLRRRPTVVSQLRMAEKVVESIGQERERLEQRLREVRRIYRATRYEPIYTAPFAPP
ncbi:MAG TPA: hypothetical protein VMG99_09145 [Thermoplasmata archaeon]|nr:hypothetical protein [Thermoplasmata archaeon]